MTKEELAEGLGKLIEHNTLTKIVLSKPRDKADKRATARLVSLKQGICLQMERLKSDGKALHVNLPQDMAAKEIAGLMCTQFLQAHVFCGEKSIQVLANAKGTMTLIGCWDTLLRLGTQQAESHNRIKQHILEEGIPVDFLIYLGVMSPEGRVYDKKQDKFRQINRFLDFVADVVDSLPQSGVLRVVDFGCGKSYLTFAVHHYLTRILGRETDVIGLDLKPDVIGLCTNTAQKLGLSGIRFELGDVNQFQTLEDVDMTISLHACDTATDGALAQAVKSRSKIILSAPCCHHELAKQIDVELLELITEHGLLKQRLSEVATDALRCRLLEICGYQTQVLEFIDPVYTPKNILIRAVRSGKPCGARKVEQYIEFRDLLHADPALERLLACELKKITGWAEKSKKGT